MVKTVLITGGAGFIGRWLVKHCLDKGLRVVAVDDLSNSSLKNIEEFLRNGRFHFYRGDVKDGRLLARLFKHFKFECVYHLAASIVVQNSIDDPRSTFNNDVLGTFEVLELCRQYRVKMVFMSTCMVYGRAVGGKSIAENHDTIPASPYAASKLAGEALVLSYYHTYKLPVTVLRPFNTYGPFQRADGEGGVIAIFLTRAILGQALGIYGTGKQTRDFIYVKDCADFIFKASRCKALEGRIINAGSGADITINRLAELVCGDKTHIKHVKHIHPQSEIMKLQCNSAMARAVLKWRPKFSLVKGLAETRHWIEGQLHAQG